MSLLRERGARYYKERVVDGCYLIFGWPDGQTLGEARRAGGHWEAILGNEVWSCATLHDAALHLVNLHDGAPA